MNWDTVTEVIPTKGDFFQESNRTDLLSADLQHSRARVKAPCSPR